MLNRRITIFLALAAILLLVMVYSMNRNDRPDVRPAVGYTAPDFALKNLKGQTVTLSALRGKPVYLNFWASWCPPCKEEMPELKRFYEKYKDRIVFLAIDTTFQEQKLEDIYASVAENQLPYPVLLDEDPDKGASYKYQITGVPTHFFIDKNGVIRHRAIGPQSMSDLENGLDKAS